MILLNLEGNWLVSQLLWALSTLNSLSVQLSNTSLWQADILDGLLLHGLWHGSWGALGDRFLGDADLVLLEDVGVLLHGVAVGNLRIKDGFGMGLLGLILDTLGLLSSDKEKYLKNYVAIYQIL